MNGERLSRCIGEVHDKYLDESESYRRKNKPVWVKWCAAAACLCLITAAVLQLRTSAPPPDGGLQISPPDYAAVDDHAIYIPAIELPEKADGIELDMIALIVYRGSIYTQAEWYYDEEAAAVQSLVGDYLGYAAGNIDEWSAQDEYSTEFASNLSGEVYSVNGYSTDFRICMAQNQEDGDGNSTQLVLFFESLNGIGLTRGQDLFGDRLNLRDNCSYVKYQEHSNWDYGWPDYVYSDLDSRADAVIDKFIDALYSGKFEYVYETNPDFYSSTGKQAHLFFHMNDGTVAELRLFEGGYVGYRPLGWCFVKMPGKIFDMIFSACQ